jgi:hypothetical protein
MSVDPSSLPETLDALAHDLDRLIETGANRAAWHDLDARVQAFCTALSAAPPDMAQDCRAPLGDMITRIETYLTEQAEIKA